MFHINCYALTILHVYAGWSETLLFSKVAPAKKGLQTNSGISIAHITTPHQDDSNAKSQQIIRKVIS